MSETNDPQTVLHGYNKREWRSLLSALLALSSVPVAFLAKNLGAAMALCGVALLIVTLADEVGGDE